jgi:hypothetical protein
LVTAHAVTDSEFSCLEDWLPPALLAAETSEVVDRPSATELKGTVQIPHVFAQACLCHVPRVAGAREEREAPPACIEAVK